MEAHDLPLKFTVGVKLSLDVRAHLNPTVDTFGEPISASTGSGKEIAGLLKNMRKMMMTRNREIACERILACQTGGR